VLEKLRSCSRIELVGLVVSTRVLSPRYGFLRGAWEQYRRSGLRYTAYLGCALARPLSTQGIALTRTRDLNAEPCRSFIAAAAPEVIISAFFNQPIGETVTAIAPSVNIHPSLLPAFKGVDPVFYARLHDAPLGVTLHRISRELDAGEIIGQRQVSQVAGESVLAATVRLYALGAQLLIDSIESIRAQTPGTEQTGAGNYDSWPGRGEVAALRRKGVRLVRLRDLLAREP
jgi:methionyl-tRNA formyltransferase